MQAHLDTIDLYLDLDARSLTWAPYIIYLDPDIVVTRSLTWTPASHPSWRGPIQIAAVGVDVALQYSSTTVQQYRYLLVPSRFPSPTVALLQNPPPLLHSRLSHCRCCGSGWCRASEASGCTQDQSTLNVIKCGTWVNVWEGEGTKAV